MGVGVAGPSVSLPATTCRANEVNFEDCVSRPPRRVFDGKAHGASSFSLGCQEWKTLRLWTPNEPCGAAREPPGLRSVSLGRWGETK